MTVNNASAKILLVEDNKVATAIATNFLDAAGFGVDHVPDGLQAITAVRRSRYALILMDLQLPGLDGFETARHIRAVRPADWVPIVAITTMNDTRGECIKAGLDDVISKPFTRQEFLDGVKRWISKTSQPPEDARRAEPPQTQEKSFLSLPEADLPRVEIQGDELLKSLPGEVRASVVLSLVEAAAEAINAMGHAAGDRNLVTLGRAAHNLKGIFGYMGALPLSVLAQRLVTSCKSEAEQDATALARQIIAQWKLASNAVDSLVARAALK